MTQWDLFIESATEQQNRLKFKTPSEGSYRMFREVLQIVDSIWLDEDCYQYQTRAIVASTLYLILGTKYNEFTFSYIAHELPTVYGLTTYFRERGDSSYFTQLFADYLYLAFGYVLEEINPTVQYVARFFQIPFNY